MPDDLEDPPERSNSALRVSEPSWRRIDDRIRELAARGVEFQDQFNAYVDDDVEIEPGAWIGAGVHIKNGSVIGAHVRIGPCSIIDGSTVGDDVEIGPFVVVSSGAELRIGSLVKARSEISASTVERGCEIGPNAMVESSHVSVNAKVGPFCRVRANSEIGPEAYVGTQAEVKASKVGHGSKIGHFSFVGDAILGRDVNIGAGAVTANFDGVDVQQTVIEEGVSVGAGTLLIAPVRLGAGAQTGAGAVVTRDVAPGSLVVGMPARVVARARTNEISGKKYQEVR